MTIQQHNPLKGLAVASIVTLIMVICSASLWSQEKKTKAPVTAALNGYSFSDLLSARNDRDKQQVYTLFNLLDWCSAKSIKALDPTAYFFPTYPEVPSDEYLQKFKEHAKTVGVVISGTGVRNNFASPDPVVRAQGVELTKKWIEAAAKMGAPVVRVFAGEIPKGYEDKWKEVAGWMIECYKECAAHGEKFGVKIGIQNHGDMLQTADQCIYVLKELNSKWVGLIVDTGSFKTADPYKDIEAVVPYAINWQIKESVFGLGSEVQTDYVKLVRIIKKGGYKGYLPIETLAEKNKIYDPFARVQQMMMSLNAAIDEAYK